MMTALTLSLKGKYFTDAMAISAQETVNTRKREDWNQMIEEWLDDPKLLQHMALV